MKIGELAKLSGIAASRIRFYEANGLLQPAQRQANGYREYAAETLTRLEIIICAQSAGFSLEEIRTVLPADLGKWPREELLLALQRKVGEIERLQERLAQSKRQLVALVAEIDNGTDGEDCTGEAKRLLEKVRHGSTEGSSIDSHARPARRRA
jgi:DNA-binding transcriptional MerR regulator